MAVRKATRKASVQKKSTRKKSSPKKSTRKKPARKAARRSAVDLIGSKLPKSLKAFGRQIRRDLSAIEKQIGVCGKETRLSLARIVRDASHQLGTLEARGEREWQSLSRNARRDIERVIRRVQKAVRT